MPTLALIRHGQSQWNLENRFTGWVDVDLTPEGETQARRAGQLLGDCGVAFDRVFTSVLTRAIRTANLALEEAGLLWLPMMKDWRLNERHYGALTGLNKAETAALHGDDQVNIWRRSYDVSPPPLDADSLFSFEDDRRYTAVANLPNTESLKTTLERTLPFWEAAIAPQLAAGKNVIIAAHGNTLRAIVKHLYGLSEKAIMGVEIPTGNPLLIDLSKDIAVTGARYLDTDRAQPLPPLP